MAGNINSSEDEIISGINITPLVDVVLVLLIIFLITAPVIYQASIKVHLAKASSGESNQDLGINIGITRSGGILWNNDQVNWQELDQHLKKLGDQVSQKTAVISADRETSHGVVVQLMDTLRKAGMTHLALNVEQIPGRP